MADRAFDVIVIGGGPAGLSAAVNIQVRNRRACVITSVPMSAKLQKAPWIDNYLGIDHITGIGLAEKFREHARAAGAEVLEDSVVGAYDMGDHFSVLTTSGDYACSAIVLATGAVQTASIEGEEDFLGRGVSYCATCDGPLYKGKRVAVIAYTAHAAEEANYLAELASQVVYAAASLDAARAGETLDPSIVFSKSRVDRFIGGISLEAIEMDGNIVPVDGAFVLRDSIPVSRLIDGLIIQDGAVRVERDMSTSVPGVFAAGDCTGQPYQISKAVGEGQIAGLSAARYVRKPRA